MASSSPPHVLIVGAGLGGLTLAQSLRKQNIPFSIFERGKPGQAQGWAIALHTVLPQLKAALPDDLPPLAESVNHLQPLALPPQLIFYPHGDPQERFGVQDDGSGTKIIRANRLRLREYLARDIPVQYGKQAVSVADLPDGGGATVTFKDGTTARGDIVVGADGVHSVVRQAVLKGRHDPLATVPVACITGEVTLSGPEMARQLELGHSAYIAREARSQSHEHFFCGLNRVHPDGRSADFYWYMAWRQDDNDDADAENGHATTTTNGNSHGSHTTNGNAHAAAAGGNKDLWTLHATREEMHARALEETRKFDPLLTQVIHETPVEGIHEPPIVFRALILGTLPVSRTMTILGDAAHSMTPFRGEGGVHALQDAINLGEAIGRIAKGTVSVEDAVAAYQEEMLERGGEAVKLSSAAMDFDPDKDEGPRMLLGYPAKPLPKETITI